MAASKSPADKASKKGFTGLKDMFDGGGMGGSGASYSSLSNEDYKRAGGKDYQEGMRRGGWTEFDQQGQGRTLRGPQAMMANPFFGGLLGLATGGASGAMMGLGGTMVRNDIRQKGGLGGLLGKQGGVAQQAAIAPILAPATSMRPQPRPQMMSSQAMPQDFYGLSGNPAMQAPLSSLQSNFAPYVPPAGTNIATANAMPPSTTGAGALGSVPIPDYGVPTQAAPQINPNMPNTPPKNMSELRYLSWLRNQGGAINVDKMSPDGLRIMYENYRTNPAFQ